MIDLTLKKSGFLQIGMAGGGGGGGGSFRKQNIFQKRQKAGIQSQQENGHIYKIKIKTWSIYLVKSFDLKGVEDKLVLPDL